MEKTVEIKGIPVFYRDRGEGDTILILHGWPASSKSWITVQNDLVEAGFRVVVPDLPGFGKTPQSKEAWSVRDYVEFVRSFEEKLDLHPRGLVGHSFGGRIAIFYAMKYKHNLPALVLIDAAGIFRHKQVRIRAHKALTKVGDYIMRFPLLHFLRPLVRDLNYRITRQRDYYLTSGTMRETFGRIIEESMRPHLPHITAPTLILWGENDKLTPLSDAHIIHQEIPVSYLHVLPHAGHSINLEYPHKVARQIYLFLRR